MKSYTDSENEPTIGPLIFTVVFVTLVAAGIAFGGMEMADKFNGISVDGNQKKSCVTYVSERWDTDIIRVTRENRIDSLRGDTTYIKVKILYDNSDSLELKFDNLLYD